SASPNGRAMVNCGIHALWGCATIKKPKKSRAKNNRLRRLAEEPAELGFHPRKNALLLPRQTAPGPIDIEIQHGHRRLKRRSFAPSAPLGGALQRERDPSRVGRGKNARLQIEGIARLRHPLRPAVGRTTFVSLPCHGRASPSSGGLAGASASGL